MTLRISADQARLGMYIHGFDGSWVSHPFWRARFLIETQEDLDRVRAGGTDLFIDIDKGVGPASERPALSRSALPTSGVVPLRAPQRAPFGRPTGPMGQVLAPRRIVAPPAFGKADRTRAVALARRSTAVVKALFEDCRLGRAVPTGEILAVVQDISDTLAQNGAAFASVTRLRSKDDGTYTHSVAVCALMISLGHEAGLSAAEVQDLGTAGLLHDIGKVSIDDAILQKAGELTAAEQVEMRRHPSLGHAILTEEPGLPAVALDVCLHHHERLDGSGYPFGLRDEAISQAARIAAICDVYDAMTSDRVYKKGLLPGDALTWMDEADGQFDPALLFRFMRSIGVYPAGRLVRLRSNRLAVILPAGGQNRRPVARAFYATVDNHFTPYEDTLLGDGRGEDQAVSLEDPRKWFAIDWHKMSKSILKGADIDLP